MTNGKVHGEEANHTTATSDTPLAPTLFQRPSSDQRHAQTFPFRAKANPFQSNSAAPSSSLSLSPPVAPLSRSAGCSASSAAGSGRSACSASASSSPDVEAPWKANLKRQCVQRVRQQRLSLQQKLRHLPADSPPPTATLYGGVAHMAAQANAALADSLRGIIHEQLSAAQSRSHGGAATAGGSAGACSAASPHFHRAAYSSAASPCPSVASSSPPPSAASSSASGGSCGDTSAFASFTAASDECLTQDELIELMAQLEEEVRREMDPEEQWAADEAAAAAAHSSSFPSSASSVAAPFPGGRSADAALAAAYAADAAAQMQADMEAAEEFDEFSSCADRLPCPVCLHPAVAMQPQPQQHQQQQQSQSSSGASMAMACCAHCGLCYSCSSLDDFRQQLADACEVHAVKCRAAPKFLMPQPQQQHALAAAASPFSTARPGVPLALALACESCRTWLTLPVQLAGWASHNSSQVDAEDEEMAS